MKKGNDLLLPVVCFLMLTAALPVNATKVARMPEIMRADMMVVDGHSLFVLDDITVHTYNLKDFRHGGQFGKQGSGPGEFTSNFVERLILQLDGDHLVLNTFRKIARFTKEGTLVAEKTIPIMAAQIVPLGKGYIITKYLAGENGINQFAVRICDETFQDIKHLYSREDITIQRSGRLDYPNEQIFVEKTDQFIFIYDQRPGTEVFVFDHAGNRKNRFTLPLPAPKMTQAIRDEVMHWAETSKQVRSFSQQARLSLDQIHQMVYFHPVLPVARYFTVQKERLLLQTWEKKDERSRFISLDLSGKKQDEFYLTDAEPGQVKMIPYSTYCFFAGNYYFFKENPDEDILELHIESY